ncbi:MAG: tRNA uridine-5-carboxymethylaminomethyl(34) synthesis enzyme MnmG [Spirochaetia bacterium]|jgi:tRNA uridine 5-carboxymethylaminomethyl modification enzyme|nr:tRNA uridine-5-carboxymethylaminomethyl(34) synthesis enzyme MnmG [Spirochaetia bacterium]
MGDYEAIVIGGGHAGIEAALALARLGAKSLLITQNPDTIGKMSCNPAIGGLAKGNLVREIDALGGQMGILADASSLQLRMLNQSRGAAVQAPRAQSDKALYSELARTSIEEQPKLSILMDTVVDIIPSQDGRRVEGVRTERGVSIGANVVVLTTGTFMEATLFIGQWSGAGGRLGEPAARGLGASLRSRGFPVDRMKTGTPARIAASSIDFSRLEIQLGETKPIFFSFLEKDYQRPNLPCHVLWTSETTHQLIRGGLDRSPLFSGQIVGKGPRYCPSIEDKVVRFPDRPRHQVFVEPEGQYTNEVYLNGLSSSLPEDIQLAFYRSLPGFEKARIVRPAYAVEYDYIETSALYASLESKILEGLYIAGQTNGTSGYEEAAAQGLMAGINARRKLDGLEPVILGREEAYIGVLIDDLVTLVPKEPYRMFTSRAERRLALRQDSADLRLTPLGISIGLVSEERREKFEGRRQGIDEIQQLLASRRIRSADLGDIEALEPHIGESLELALRDPALGAIMDDAPSASSFLSRLIPEAGACPESWAQTALLEARYQGYLEKESRLASRLDRSERLRIPSDFDYRAVPGLSKEAMEKLEAVKPLTLGQASRVTGVRKSDLALLYIVVSRQG